MNHTPEGDKRSSRRIVFIAGMHRSGTSFLARALNLAGLQIPQPDTGHDNWNQEGQWETTALIQASLGLFGGVDRWFDPVVTNSGPEVLTVMRQALEGFCQGKNLWGWKDPRLLITLPYWLEELPPGWSPELVIALRNPMQIAGSLMRRNKFGLADGLRICDRYLSQALAYPDGPMPVHFFNFNAPDLETELTRISKSLGLTPNPQAWKKWYRPDLVNQNNVPAPAMPSYESLHARWRVQAGETTLPSCSAPQAKEKPGLRLAVLLDNRIKQPEPNTWLEPCLEQLAANTSVYCDYKVFTQASHDLPNDLLHRFGHRLQLVPQEEPQAAADPGGMLQVLYDFAARHYEVGHVLIMHRDAWPIRPNWDLGPLTALDGPVELMGILGKKQGAAPHIDPAFMLLNGGCIARLNLRLDEPDLPGAPPLSHITQKVIKAHGPKALLMLGLGGVKPLHPEIGQVYGGMIYHHNACAFQPAKATHGLKPGAMDPASLQAALTGKVFQEPRAYFEELRHGIKAREFGLLRCLLAADSSSRQHRRLMNLAGECLAIDPEQSLYICGLLSRVYAYNPGFLDLYAQACARTGLVLDQAALNGIKRYLLEHPLGKKIATS